MEQFAVAQVKNVSASDYVAGYDGNWIEFKPGESKTLPANVARFIVEKSWQTVPKKSALELVEPEPPFPAASSEPQEETKRSRR